MSPNNYLKLSLRSDITYHEFGLGPQGGTEDMVATYRQRNRATVQLPPPCPSCAATNKLCGKWNATRGTTGPPERVTGSRWAAVKRPRTKTPEVGGKATSKRPHFFFPEPPKRLHVPRHRNTKYSHPQEIRRAPYFLLYPVLVILALGIPFENAAMRLMKWYFSCHLSLGGGSISLHEAHGCIFKGTKMGRGKNTARVGVCVPFRPTPTTPGRRTKDR